MFIEAYDSIEKGQNERLPYTTENYEQERTHKKIQRELNQERSNVINEIENNIENELIVIYVS